MKLLLITLSTFFISHPTLSAVTMMNESPASITQSTKPSMTDKTTRSLNVDSTNTSNLNVDTIVEGNKECIDRQLASVNDKNPSDLEIRQAFKYCGPTQKSGIKNLNSKDFNEVQRKVIPEGKSSTRPRDGSNTNFN